jgi:hypothetical protein
VEVKWEEAAWEIMLFCLLSGRVAIFSGKGTRRNRPSPKIATTKMGEGISLSGMTQRWGVKRCGAAVVRLIMKSYY